MSMRAFLSASVLVGLAFAGCKDDKTLKVTGIDPRTGEVEGGTVVTVKGNRFTADGVRTAKVYFGHIGPNGESGEMKPGDVLGFEGDDTLNVRAPAGEKDGDVVDILIVFEPGGPITLKQAFTYHNTKNLDVNDLDTSKAGKK
jgi:hypothetical protein